MLADPCVAARLAEGEGWEVEAFAEALSWLKWGQSA
jgi:hypothetical protein